MWTRLVLAAAILASLVDGAIAAVGQSPLQWQTSLENAKRQAAASNQLVLIHFWAPFCGACRRMDEDVFPDPQVVQVLQQQYVPVKLNSEQFPATANQYGITKLPTDVIITPSGQVIKKSEGYLKAPEYAGMLTQVASTRPAGSMPAVAANIPGPQPVNTAYAPPSMNSGATPAMGGGYSANGYSSNGYASRGYTPNGASGGVTAGPANGFGAAAAPIGSTGTGPAAGSFNGGNPYSFASGAAGQAIPPIASVPLQASQPNAALAPPVGNLVPPTANLGSSGGGFVPPVGSMAPPAANFSGQSALADRTAAPPAAATVAKDSPLATVASRNGAFSDPIASRSASSSSLPAGMAVAAATNTAAAITPPAAGSAAGSGNTTGNPPLALEGFCPVELQERHAWVQGDKRWGVIHLGKLYLFAGADQWQRFFANPEKYAPVLSGMDIVAAVERNQFVSGDRRFGGYYENRLYLFTSEENLQKFDREPQRYATAAAQQFKATSTNRMR